MLELIHLGAPLSFIPHGHCYLWQPRLVWLHVTSDALIALSYYSIPVTLVYLVRQRRDLPFDWIFLLFGLFIIACGTTHVMDVWTLWHPNYWTSGTIKLATAAVSFYTAISLVPTVPKVLALPSPSQLAAANHRLEHEVIERKRIEESLRQSEARYRAIVEDQTEMVCRFKPDGTLSFVNEPYCRCSQRPQEQLLGTLFTDALPVDGEAIWAHLRTLTPEAPSATVEECITAPSGDVIWLQWSDRAIFDAQGQLIEYQSVGRDITQRKWAENALETSQRFNQKIADTAPVLLYVYDLINDCNIYANGEAANLLGYTPDDLLDMGSNLLPTILHPDDLAEYSDRYSRWLGLRDGEIAQSEYRMQHSNGEWRYFQCQETLFARTPEGAPQQILGAAIDITAVKQLEELRKAEERLQTSLREKEVLLKEVHHRVKNNLQMVYSLLRLQYRRVQDPQVAEILLDSQNRVKAIAFIHEKLYRSGDLTLVNLTQYIPTLASSLFHSHTVTPGMVELRTHVDEIFVDIDTAIPYGLLINELVSNAIKYAFPENRAGTIELTLRTITEDQLLLTVRDDGVGLPVPIDLAKADSLGLKLVNDLVRQLNGQLQIHSHQGTEFTITLPRNRS
ncbi:MAG TPA: histidine kinase dimerization/phosphoacceptor domain -containing protein [Chroococcidiopsis sp.]